MPEDISERLSKLETEFKRLRRRAGWSLALDLLVMFLILDVLIAGYRMMAEHLRDHPRASSAQAAVSR
jgi:hypothetical protein